MKMEDKGPHAPASHLPGPAGAVVAAVSAWSGVVARAHWHLYRPTEVDGFDFYVGAEELGHVHLDGEAHIAMTRPMRDAALSRGVGRAAPRAGYEGWLHLRIVDGDAAREAVALFRVNHARLHGAA